MSRANISLLKCIVSGGQTGVDRGALDAAIDFGIAHGGWCPRGRRAEDGSIPSRYELDETNSSDYQVRTEQNVIDSDGTLILYRERMMGGTLLTYRLACKHKKPCLKLDLARCDATRIAPWLQDHRIRVLNVAGPRESTAPGIGAQAYQLIIGVLAGHD